MVPSDRSNGRRRHRRKIMPSASSLFALSVMGAAACLLILGEVRLSSRYAPDRLLGLGFLPPPKTLPTTSIADAAISAESNASSPPHPRYGGRRRPVVAVYLTPDKHMLYKGRQKRLCKLISDTQRRAEEERRKERERRGAADPNRTQQSTSPLVLLNMTTSCVTWGNKSTIGLLGTGNVVLGLYAVRLAALAHGADFVFRCTEDATGSGGREARSGAVVVGDKIGPFRWLQGYFSAADSSSFSPRYYPPLPNHSEACRGMGFIPLHYMSDYIRREFRAMAVGMFGARDDIPGTRAYAHSVSAGGSSSSSPPPPLADAPLDDVAIHLRCGDVLRGSGGKYYGFLPFRTYLRHIVPADAPRTVGVVTVPFDQRYLRRRDQGTSMKCGAIARALVEYLRARLPRAVVTVRNGPNETAAVSMARLVLAREMTFVGPTTFGAFPAVASFGRSYVHGGATNWFVNSVAEAYEDVVIMEEKQMITAGRVKKMGLNYTLSWLLAEG